MKFNFFSSSIALFLVGYTVFLSSSFKSRVEAASHLSKEEVRFQKQNRAAIGNARDFLYWYRDNLKKANSFPMLTKDSRGYCQVNMPACKKYLEFLNSSELLSPQYFADSQVFFDSAAKRIAADHLTDEVPEDFDLDLVLGTQEPELILSKIDSLRFIVVSMSDSSALMNVNLPSDPTVSYQFEMVKKKYSWKIGNISIPDYE